MCVYVFVYVYKSTACVCVCVSMSINQMHVNRCPAKKAVFCGRVSERCTCAYFQCMCVDALRKNGFLCGARFHTIHLCLYTFVFIHISMCIHPKENVFAGLVSERCTCAYFQCMCMDALQKKDIFVGLVFTRITCVSTNVFICICLYTCVYYPKRTMQQTQRHLLYAVHPATPCNALQHPATHYNTLQHTATQRISQRHLLYAVHVATPCNTLQHLATHYNTAQQTSTQHIPQRHLLYAVHPATPCNTLQHPVTPYNAAHPSTTFAKRRSLEKASF